MSISQSSLQLTWRRISRTDVTWTVTAPWGKNAFRNVRHLNFPRSWLTGAGQDVSTWEFARKAGPTCRFALFRCTYGSLFSYSLFPFSLVQAGAFRAALGIHGNERQKNADERSYQVALADWIVRRRIANITFGHGEGMDMEEDPPPSRKG